MNIKRNEGRTKRNENWTVWNGIERNEMRMEQNLKSNEWVASSV